MRTDLRKHATGLGYYWSAERLTRNQLRDICLSYDPEKRASIGGEQESGFEQAFSSLAWAYLKDKAPRLIDFVVGFQLVDRNEDNTKAVGVFGFKVGNQWLYAPVFFLNGDLKGHELMYIKKQDMFVPLKENWVNYILARKPHILGEGSQKDVYQLGGLAPNIEKLTWPPSNSKFGSDRFDALLKRANGLACYPGSMGAMAAGPTAPDLSAMAAGGGNTPGGGMAGTPAPKPSVPTTQPRPSAPAPAPAPAPTPPADGGGDGELFPNVPAQSSTGGMGMGGMDSYKMGMPVDQWAREFLPPLAACAVKSARFLHREAAHGRTLDLDKVTSQPFKAALALSDFDLRQFLSSDWRLAKVAFDMSRQYPLIAQGFTKFYGPHFFSEVAMACKAASETIDVMTVDEKPKPRKKIVQSRDLFIDLPGEKKAAATSKVKILTERDVATMINKPELTEDDKKKVLHHGYLVKDERTGDEVSIAYNTQLKQVLTNPAETGIYDVLESPGNFGRMLVVTAPMANDGTHDLCLAVRLDDGDKSWVNIGRTSIFAREVESREDFSDWFEKLPKRDNLSKGGTYVAISETGEGTLPFEVREVYDDAGYETYKVDFSDYPVQGSRPRAAAVDPYDDYVSMYGGMIVCEARKGTRLRAVAGELHIPENFKFLKLKDPPKPKKTDDDYEAKCCDGPANGSDPKPISCGNIKDVQLLFSEKTASLKLYADQHEVAIKSEKRGSERMSWTQGLFSLIKNHGLTEKQAAEMLKTAQYKGSVVYRVKYADGYPFGGGGPTAPVIPSPQYGTEQMGYNSVRSIYPQDDAVPVPGLEASLTDPRIYDPFLNITPDQSAMQTAQSAAQQGQKEVFDTSMLSGMLKAVRQDTLVDRYLGDLMKALDKLGRLLFLFFWHGEEFEDRYGKADMPELEDTLRNTFENLGETVLFLKEKSVEPNLDEIAEPSIEQTARN